MGPVMELSAVIRRQGALFVAWTPDLDVASQGPSEEEALANLKEAVALYLEDADAQPAGPVSITSFQVDEPTGVGASGRQGAGA